MRYNIENILTESERNRIKNLHNQPKKNRDFIFEACISVDEKYFILHDNVFDIQEQKSLGNIWDSIDTFKTIFNTVNVNDSTGEFQTIKESLNKLPILENEFNLHSVKNTLLEWSFYDDTWLGNKLKDAGTSMSNTYQEGLKKLKEFGIQLSNDEWNEILNLLGKGVIWTLRKLKNAIYSTLGIIVDAILVATGIGKGAQMVAWGLVTALDIYQFINNDWPEEEKNDPTWLKLLYIGFDFLGLVSAGALAKVAKTEFNTIKSMGNDTKKVSEYIQKNPKMKSVIENILNSTKKVPQVLTSVKNQIVNKFPKGAQFISNILSKLGGLFSTMEKNLAPLVGIKTAKGIGAGAKATGVVYGLEKGIENYTQKKTGLSPVQIKNLNKMDDIINKTYGGKDPFDF